AQTRVNALLLSRGAPRGTTAISVGQPNYASAVLEHQRMDGKICAGVGPCGDGNPSRSARQGREVFERVFIAVLGVDRLAGAELDDPSAHAHLLTLLPDEVHLDAVAFAIVESAVVEAREIEIAIELAIDALEQVEVELRRQAGRVVVGGIENARVLHQVDPDDQRCAASQHAAGVAQESASFMRLEIADG